MGLIFPGLPTAPFGSLEGHFEERQQGGGHGLVHPLSRQLFKSCVKEGSLLQQSNPPSSQHVHEQRYVGMLKEVQHLPPVKEMLSEAS